jgi:hypothetical protein
MCGRARGGQEALKAAVAERAAKRQREEAGKPEDAPRTALDRFAPKRARHAAPPS